MGLMPRSFLMGWVALAFCPFSVYAGYSPSLDAVSEGYFDCPRDVGEFRVLRDTLVIAIKPEQLVNEDNFHGFASRWERCLETDQTFARVYREKTEVRECFKNILRAGDSGEEWSSNGPPPAPKVRGLEWPPELLNKEFLRIATGAMSKSEKKQLDALLGVSSATKQAKTSPTDGTNLERAARYLEKEVNAKKPEGEKWNLIPYKTNDLDRDATLIVDIPGDPEKIVQIEQSINGQPSLETAVIVIRTAPDGQKEIIATDHTSLGSTPESYTGNGLRQVNTRQCQSCHHSGLKGFLPVDLDPKYQSNYDSFISHVRSLAPLSWANRRDQPFPVLAENDGLQESRRTDAFFRRCAPGLSAEAVNRVKKSMNCAECHASQASGGSGGYGFPSNNTHGPKNVILEYLKMSNSAAKTYLKENRSPFFGDNLLMYIMTGKMPKKGNQLTSTDERTALFRCLITEYYTFSAEVPGIFQTWLAKGDCGVSSRLASSSLEVTR